MTLLRRRRLRAMAAWLALALLWLNIQPVFAHADARRVERVMVCTVYGMAWVEVDFGAAGASAATDAPADGARQKQSPCLCCRASAHELALPVIDRLDSVLRRAVHVLYVLPARAWPPGPVATGLFRLPPARGPPV